MPKAVVVDDHDMGVTDVIRGDDHLTNTFRQLALIDALGWPRPGCRSTPSVWSRAAGRSPSR